MHAVFCLWWQGTAIGGLTGTWNLRKEWTGGEQLHVGSKSGHTGRWGSLPKEKAMQRGAEGEGRSAMGTDSLNKLAWEGLA